MRKKPTSLWKAGLIGAGFGVFINVINYSEGRFGPRAFPPTPDQATELAVGLMFGVILFVTVAESRNWRLQRREKRT